MRYIIHLDGHPVIRNCALIAPPVYTLARYVQKYVWSEANTTLTSCKSFHREGLPELVDRQIPRRMRVGLHGSDVSNMQPMYHLTLFSYSAMQHSLMASWNFVLAKIVRHLGKLHMQQRLAWSSVQANN